MLQLNSEMITKIKPSLRTMQVITMALVMAPVLFIAVILAAIGTEGIQYFLSFLDPHFESQSTLPNPLNTLTLKPCWLVYKHRTSFSVR